MSTRLVAASALAVLALGSPAFAQPSNFHVADIVEDVKDADAPQAGKKPTDVVILSEGYQDRATFMKRAKALAKQLRDDQASEVFRSVTTFEFHYVWVPSKDAGAPWRNGEDAGDTPFGAHVAKDGSLATDDGAVNRAVKHVLADSTHDAVAVILIHLLSKQADKAKNAPKHADGDNAGPDDVRDISDTPEDVYVALQKKDTCRHGGHEIGRVRQVDIDMRAFIHEFGHARFGLDDEYADDPNEALPAEKRSEVALYPNTTTDSSGSRWRRSVPQLYDADGKIRHIEEGGSGYGKGVWHAEHLCRMHQSRNQPFCRVCQAAIQASVDADPLTPPVWVTPKDGSTVASGTLQAKWQAGEDPLSWHLELVQDGKVVWKDDVEGSHRTDDVPLPAGSGFTLRISGARIAKANPDNRTPVVGTTFSVGDASATEKPSVGITNRIDSPDR